MSQILGVIGRTLGIIQVLIFSPLILVGSIIIWRKKKDFFNLSMLVGSLLFNLGHLIYYLWVFVEKYAKFSALKSHLNYTLFCSSSIFSNIGLSLFAVGFLIFAINYIKEITTT